MPVAVPFFADGKRNGSPEFRKKEASSVRSCSQRGIVIKYLFDLLSHLQGNAGLLMLCHPGAPRPTKYLRTPRYVLGLTGDGAGNANTTTRVGNTR